MSEINYDEPLPKRPRLVMDQSTPNVAVSPAVAVDSPPAPDTFTRPQPHTSTKPEASPAKDDVPPPLAGDDDDDSDEDLFGEHENTPTEAKHEAPSNPEEESEENHQETPEQEIVSVEVVKELEINAPPSSDFPLPILNQASIPPGNPPIPGKYLSMKNVDSDSVVSKQKSPEDASSVKPEPTVGSSTELVIPRKSPSKPTSKDLAIPRKSPSKSNSAPEFRPAPQPTAPPQTAPEQNGSVLGSSYGLPEGVVVPQTIVRNRLFETEMNSPGSKLMEILKSLPVNLINDALVEYDDAVDIKGTTAIRNHGAYLFGVVKRYVSVHERAISGEGVGILPMGAGLTPEVESRLEGLVSSGFCTAQEMNEKVKSKIRMLSEKDALFALDELSSVDRSSIRNFGSYFMGILNRYMRGDVSSKARPRPSPQSLSSSNQYVSDNAPPSQRRNDGGNRPWQPQQNSMLSPVGTPNQHPPNRGGQMNHHGFGPGPSHPSHFQQHNVQQRTPHFNPHPPPFTQQTGTGYHPNAPQMSNNIPIGNNVQLQGSNSFQQHPNQMSGGISGQHQPYGGQQQFHQPYAQQHPQMNQPPMGSYQQHQHPNMMTPHRQQQPFGQQQPYTQQPYGQQQSYGQQQQPWQPKQETPSSIDIFGLADKAASAIQAMGASQNIGQQMFGHQQQGFTTPLQPQQQAFVPTPQYVNPMQSQQQQQYQTQHPVGFSPMGSVGAYNQPQPMQNSQGLVQGKRRTTANLVATGALDALPDEGIMGMIHDLPENLAIASLQKFDILDKTSMRNKTAYLAGVLRRELEKINRR